MAGISYTSLVKEVNAIAQEKFGESRAARPIALDYS